MVSGIQFSHSQFLLISNNPILPLPAAQCNSPTVLFAASSVGAIPSLDRPSGSTWTPTNTITDRGLHGPMKVDWAWEKSEDLADPAAARPTPFLSWILCPCPYHFPVLPPQTYSNLPLAQFYLEWQAFSVCHHVEPTSRQPICSGDPFVAARKCVTMLKSLFWCHKAPSELGHKSHYQKRERAKGNTLKEKQVLPYILLKVPEAFKLFPCLVLFLFKRYSGSFIIVFGRAEHSHNIGCTWMETLWTEGFVSHGQQQYL